uniref:Patched domain-containing protein 3 n=1 Tax=Ascaris suum TaxID=6253 RepID=F1KV80_ASCSU
MKMNVSTDTRLQPTLFIRTLNRFFRSVGYLVADHSIAVIVVFSILTAAFSLKIPFTKKQDDLKTGYTPIGARSLDELQAFRQYFDGLDPVLLFVVVTAKDGKSLNLLTHLNATVAIVDHVGKTFAMKGRTYYDICKNFCDANEPVLQYRNGLVVSESRGGGSVENLMNLSFPIISFIGRDMDLSPNFFGVTTYKPEEMNGTQASNIKDLKMIILQFRAQKPKDWDEDDIFQWERSVGDYYRKNYSNPFIHPVVVSLAYTQDELVRTGLTLFPFISVGFAIMCTFAIITVFIGSAYQNQWSIHKITYALTACVTPLMATSTAFGITIILGFRFGTVLCVTPFLVLAIGVDDAFLMINAWNRICAERRRDGIREEMRERMADVLIEVGPSITITSLTNTVAFGMGLFMPTPEIRLLCIATAVAIFLDYIYTITMYAAIMSIGGRFEMSKEICEKVPRNDNEPTKAQAFLDNYCNWLSSWFTSLVMLILLGLYWWASIKAGCNARPSLTPEKLFLSDSPLIELSDLRNRYVLPVYAFVTIFVTNPGDLRNASRVERIERMIDDFEALPACNGPRFTRFWLRDYRAHLATEAEEFAEDTIQDPAPFSTEDIKAFIEWPEYHHWGGFMKFDNNTYRISSFFVSVAYHGSNQSDWTQRLNMLKSWRAVADNYSDIGAVIYEDEALFMDQIETMLPITIQTSIATLICMAVVCFIFMYNLFTVFIAVASITSICVGVFGFITLWGIDLDPISMATLIMSIGLSVDFPAHITFHYYRTGLDPSFRSIKERMLHSLIAIGFPLLQCSASTILFVLCLLLVPCYMSEVFVKAIVLVISLGIIHALIVVPALLCALSNIYQRFIEKKDSQSTSSQTTHISKLSQSPMLRRIRSSTGNKVAPLRDNNLPR